MCYNQYNLTILISVVVLLKVDENKRNILASTIMSCFFHDFGILSISTQLFNCDIQLWTLIFVSQFIFNKLINQNVFIQKYFFIFY